MARPSKKSRFLCASGDHAERRGKFFRSIKIFHNSPILCASGYHAAGEVANATLEAITRRTTLAEKMNGVENLIIDKNFQTDPLGRHLRFGVARRVDPGRHLRFGVARRVAHVSSAPESSRTRRWRP